MQGPETPLNKFKPQREVYDWDTRPHRAKALHTGVRRDGTRTGEPSGAALRRLGLQGPASASLSARFIGLFVDQCLLLGLVVQFTAAWPGPSEEHP